MSASTELAEAVRHWVHFDNLAESLNKQVTNVRNLRSEYETKVLDMLDKNGMRNATLKINGASLQRASRFKSADLGWGMLEEQLHEYYKTTGKADDTAAVMAFLQKNRGGKTVEYLKKTTSQPTQIQPTLPSGILPTPNKK